MTKKKTEEVEIKIPGLVLKMMTIELRGLTPLVMNKFSDKAQREMEDKTLGLAKHKKPPRDPEAEYLAALHTIKKGVYGFPANAFKCAAISACRFTDIKMTFAKGAFHVMGELIELSGSKPVRYDAVVRVGGFGKSVSMMRYRPKFDEWSVKLPIRYNAAALQPSQIVNLFNVAGFAIGIGEGRPEKAGGLSFGQFEVATGGAK